MDDKKDISYGLNENSGYGLNNNISYGLDNNTSYGLNSGDTERDLANWQSKVSEQEEKEYGLARSEAEQVAYDTMREDAYAARVNSNLEALSIGEVKVPNPEYDREYTSERAESLLNSLSGTNKDNKSISHSLYDLPVYEVLDKQKMVVSTRDQSSVSFDKLKQIGKYIAIAAVSGAITIGVIAGGIDVVKNPDPVMPEKSPQAVELENKINNAQNFDEVIDAINENQEFNQNVYSVPDSYNDTNSKGGRTN